MSADRIEELEDLVDFMADKRAALGARVEDLEEALRAIVEDARDAGVYGCLDNLVDEKVVARGRQALRASPSVSEVRPLPAAFPLGAIRELSNGKFGIVEEDPATKERYIRWGTCAGCPQMLDANGRYDRQRPWECDNYDRYDHKLRASIEDHAHEASERRAAEAKTGAMTDTGWTEYQAGLLREKALITKAMQPKDPRPSDACPECGTTDPTIDRTSAGWGRCFDAYECRKRVLAQRPNEALPKIDVHASGEWLVGEGHGGWYRALGPARDTAEAALADAPHRPDKAMPEPNFRHFAEMHQQRADRLQNEVSDMRLEMATSGDELKRRHALLREGNAALRKENQRMATRIGALRKRLGETHAYVPMSEEKARSIARRWADQIGTTSPELFEWRLNEIAHELRFEAAQRSETANPDAYKDLFLASVNERNETMQELVKLRAQTATLIGALKFYAPPEQWGRHGDAIDEGATARSALELLEKGEGGR